MRHCILHIGGHKTGSSTLQQLFMENQETLNQHGLLYPLCGQTTGTQRNLFFEMAGNKQFDPKQPTWSWLKETLQKSDHDVLILSSEIFSTIPRGSRIPRKIERFFRSLDITVQVVAYVRPQHELLNSMYSQRLRLLNSDHHFARWAPRELLHRLYHYETALRPWDRSGTFFLTVLPYNAATKDEGILRDFIAATGLSDRLAGTQLADLKDRRNASPGPMTVETFRRLASNGGRRRFRGKLHDLRNAILGESMKRGWNQVPFNGVNERMRTRITRRFAKENRRLAQEFFPKGWQATFHKELTQPLVVNEYDPKHASKEDEKEIADLVQAMRARFGAGGKAG